ncbi:MAG: hypothetical protein KF773_00180 [Deltaproteobacteria bacterium]|nr:hypothetical protein [Deltaproteobacteria bacterium]MCW5802265.1 hypothetical protein [Deltaproteobacteria bacterium]
MSKKILLGSVAAASLLGACKWTEFDDLADSTWVESTQKPDSDSANWGVAVARIKRTGEGGRLAVIGASQALYSEVVFSPTGGSSVADGAFNLNKQFGIGNVEAQPIHLADPATDENVLITRSGSASIAVIRGIAGTIDVKQVFEPERPDAATFLVAPSIDGAAGVQISQPIVAQDDKVFGAFYAPPENPFRQVKCRLTDANGAVNVRGLGAVRGLDPADATKASDDLVVLSSTGKLYIYDGGVFNGARGGAACPDATPGDDDNTGTALPFPDYAQGFDLGLTFTPVAGAQILVFDRQFALIQAHDDSGKSYLGLVDLAAAANVSSPDTRDGLKTIATAVVGTTRYVAAGYPRQLVDGTEAGQVMLFKVETARGGIATTPEVTLHDAQLENNQAFGRALTFMPFSCTNEPCDNNNVLVVGADNELFTYFRLDPIYGDRRAGR